MGPAMSIWTRDIRPPVRLPVPVPLSSVRHPHHVSTGRPGHSHHPLCNTPQEQVGYSAHASPNLVPKIQNKIFTGHFSHTHTGAWWCTYWRLPSNISDC